LARELVLNMCVGGWLSHIGPVTSSTLRDVLSLTAGDIDQTLLRLESGGSVLRGQFTEASRGEIEWCDRRLLARIHRLTVGTLRKQIQPVSAAQFMRWLLRWQHVAPGTQVLGERGTLEVIQQLQGFEAPANAWEDRILARRIANYDSKSLDQLCLTGAIGWGRLSPHKSMMDGSESMRRRVVPSSVAPITFFIREHAEWMVPHTRDEGSHSNKGLSEGANTMLMYLRQHGASFFADIVRGTKMIKAEVEGALWELVTAGFITADGFDNIRAMVDPRRRAGKGKMHSARPRHSMGRWSILHIGEVPERERTIEAICWTVLTRYGVVFREILARESMVPRWRELLIMLRRLEDRGEIRGGRFVSGFLGEQFALPIAIDSLRATSPNPATGELITISAADPLNLVGILVPGERISPTSLKYISLRDGVPVTVEDSGTMFPAAIRFALAGEKL
jgi:ATP-dependent helicase Lhr and Lhr-like helicase